MQLASPSRHYRLFKTDEIQAPASTENTMARSRRLIAAGALLALSLIASACGGSNGSAGKSNGAPANQQRPLATSSSGCGHTASLGTATLHAPFGGRSRQVIVHVPVTYKTSSPAALVLNLHGSGSDPLQQEAFSGMDATSDQYGFIVAYPEGGIKNGAGYDWNIPGVPLFGGQNPPAGAPNDVKFLTGLVPYLSSHYCVNPAMVYVTGMSGGGRMSSQLACDASGTFAAAAPVAGLRLPTPCPTSRPVPIVAFHGTSDPVDPYNGHGQAYWTYSVPEAAKMWAAKDKCSATPQQTSRAGYTLTQYVNCSGGAGVQLYSVIGEGHEWPGGPILSTTFTKLLGPQSGAISANTTMWQFFQAHPMSR